MLIDLQDEKSHKSLEENISEVIHLRLYIILQLRAARFMMIVVSVLVHSRSYLYFMPTTRGTTQEEIYFKSYPHTPRDAGTSLTSEVSLQNIIYSYW